MSTARITMGLGLLMLSAVVHPVCGDSGMSASPGLQQALAKLPRDRTVTVVGTDGTRLPGRVLGFNAEGTLLLLRPVEASADAPRTLPLEQVGKFEWRQRGRPTFAGIVAGALIGGAVGFLVGEAASNKASGMDEAVIGEIASVGGGIVLGALTATVAPLFLNRTRTIDCDGDRARNMK
jgi:hypothetical protein